jgi:predicted nucleic acid-binding protein
VRFYLDSMVWIYAFEGNPAFGAEAQSFFRRLRSGNHTILVSHFLLGELLVLPIRDADTFLIAAYKRAMLASATLEVVPFTAEVAATFATLRGLHRTQPADSIHLALSATAKADVFVTVDDRLQKLTVQGIGAIADLTYNIS